MSRRDGVFKQGLRREDPLRTIAAILGHRDIRMTSRYAHLTPDHLRDAMATLERRVRG
jgi:site-specific recombinase XerD